MMEELKKLRRRVELKSQAVALMAQDLAEHRRRLRAYRVQLFLTAYLRYLESQAERGYDQQLSRRVDCARFLLAAEREANGQANR